MKNHIKKTLRNFINENQRNEELIDFIRETLVDEEEFNELYNGDLELAWKKFVDNQENGDCQGIVASIIAGFGGSAKKYLVKLKLMNHILMNGVTNKH